MQNNFITPKDALLKLLQFREKIFSTEQLIPLDAWLNQHKDTLAWNARRQSTRGQVESLVLQLSDGRAIAQQVSLIAEQPVEIRYYLWERFVYLELALKDFPPDCQPEELPADFGEFLRQGLIELWHFREQRGWFP